MPFDLEIDGHVVHLRFHGTVNAADYEKAVNAIAAHPSFDNQRVHLVDFTAATLPPLDRRVLYAMAPVIGATSTNSQIDMIFVPDCEQTRALAHFCRPVFTGLRSISFFSDRAAAMDWIGAQTSTFYVRSER